MSGHRRMRIFAVVLAFALGAFTGGCQSTEAADPDLTSVTTQSTTTTEALSTTTTAAPSTTPTTLSELQQAEADIEAVIQAWWTYPVDSSLGEDGLPLEHLTGLLYDRVVQGLASFEEQGQIYLSQEPGQIDLNEFRIDLDSGEAVVDVCAYGGLAILDAETREVVAAATSRDGYLGSVTAQAQSDGSWKVSDYFSTDGTAQAEICELASSTP